MLTRILSEYHRGRMAALLECLDGQVYRVTYVKRHSTLERAQRDLMTFIPPSEQAAIVSEIANNAKKTYSKPQ